MQAYLNRSGLGGKMRELPVLDAWSRAVGETLGQRARAVSFRDGELVIEVDSAAHRQELANFTGEGYRRLTNRTLGREEIRRVVFKLKR